MRRLASVTSLLASTLGGWVLACSLVVDTDLPGPGGDPRRDGGSPSDAGEGGDGGAPGGCSIDPDCTRLNGPRSACVRGQCFDLAGGCTRTERVDQNVRGPTTWEPDTCYELEKDVYVESGTLTIRPGTRIVGLQSSSALVVTRNGRISANGTPADPIVFTSSKPVGQRRPGDWGGLAILGRGRLNPPEGERFLEGLPESPESIYGDRLAPRDDHDCGSLRYVRVEFAGFELTRNNELNGLTLAGCGENTRVEYVQVHYGADDGVEIFGGSVGIKWIVVSRAQDDSIDWDLGWTGWAQYVAILQDEPRPELDVNLYTGGDNGIEADSLSMTEVGRPRSRPRLYNFTMVGSRRTASRTRGMLLREGTSAEMRNFLVRGYALGLWDVQHAITADCLRTPLGATCEQPDAFVLDGLLLEDMGPDGVTFVLPDASDNDAGFDEAAFVIRPGTPRSVLLVPPASSGLAQADLELEARIDLRPPPTSPANLAAENPPIYGNRPEQVNPDGRNHIGAFAPGGPDWTEGWTAYPRN